MRMVFKPLGRWPRPKTQYPERAPFRSTWTETLRLLEREIEMLRGNRQRQDEVLIQVDAPSTAMRLDGGLRADARVGFHGVIVSFESKFGFQSFMCDKYNLGGYARNSAPAWQHNGRAIALGLEALRKVDRYGIADSGQQYTGWKALGAGEPIALGDGRMTVVDAMAILEAHTGVQCDPKGVTLSTADELNAAYRPWARKNHPDQGGDQELFKLVTAARDVLLRRSTVGV